MKFKFETPARRRHSPGIGLAGDGAPGLAAKVTGQLLDAGPADPRVGLAAGRGGVVAEARRAALSREADSRRQARRHLCKHTYTKSCELSCIIAKFK